METLLVKDEISEYKNIISKYNSDIERERIELYVRELIEHLNKNM